MSAMKTRGVITVGVWVFLLGMSQACEKSNNHRSTAVTAQGNTDLAAVSPAQGGPAANGLPALSAQPIALLAAPTKCMDVRTANSANGTPVQIFDCNQTNAQNWTFVNGTLQGLGGKCLDVTEGSRANGTRLQIWDCTPNNPNQRWQIVGNTLVWEGQNKCVDLTDGNQSNFTTLQIVDCEPNNPNQQWKLGTGALVMAEGMPQTMPQAPAPAMPEPVVGSSSIPADSPLTDPSKWELVWQDEFSGSSIDQSKWSHEVNCWGGGNGEQQCYTDRSQNSFVKDGALNLVLQKEYFTGNDGQDGKGAPKSLPYTSARLRTLNKGDFKYGKVCARAKLPMGQGVWPAIWMLPTEWKYGGWPMSGEIDIMEAVNLKPYQQSQIFGTLHFGGDQQKGRWQYSHEPARVFSGDASEHPGLNFHTYCVLWDDDSMHWEIDGNVFANFSNWYTESDQGRGQFPQPFDQKFHIILNVAVGGNFPGNPDDATAATPEAMVVDWVRVFTCKANPTKPSKC